MTSRKTSEIVRHLAGRDGVEPPEGLLEKIKSQIPAELPALPAATVTEIGDQLRAPRRRVWLMAASLAATVGAGVLGLRMMQTMPHNKEAASPETAARVQELPRGGSPAVPQTPPAPPRAIAPEADQEKKTEAPQSGLKTLGYLRGRQAQPAPQPQAVPAPPPLRPTPPAAAKPAAPQEEQISVLAESPLEGGVPAGVSGEEGSEKAAVPLLDERRRETREPWAVLQTAPGVKTDRINVGGNESGQQSNYVGPALARVEDFVSSFSYGDEPPVRGDFAVRAEGAPSPFASDAGARLLRFNIRSQATETPPTADRDAEARVELNPEVVARWRPLVPAGRIGAGQSFTALYEVHLKPGVTGSEKIATLHLGFHAAATGERQETTRDLRVADLAPSWETAPPGLRLAAIAAELAEVRGGSSKAKDAGLDDLLRRARQLAAELAKSPQAAAAADLVRLVEETARLKQQKEK